MELKEASRHYLLHEHLSPLNDIMHQADLKAEMQYHKDIEAAFEAGAQWSRNLLHMKYESLISYIDLFNHGAITLDQHEVLDKVLEFSGITEDELRRIRKVYPPELLESKTIKEE